MVEETQECLLLINLTLDGNPVNNGVIVFTRIIREGENETYETYKLITDKNGNVRKKLPYGEYKVHAEYTIDSTEKSSVQYFTYDTYENLFIQTEKENLIFKLYRCENEVLLSRNCKYFLHEPYMTPNNYDLYFNYNSIPVNNIIESPHNLRKRLQRKLPLTKILHLNLESSEEPEYNTVHLKTKLKMEYVSSENNYYYYRLNGEWDEQGLLEKLYSAYNEYLLDNSEGAELQEGLDETVVGQLPISERIKYYTGLIELSLDKYMEQEEVTLDSFKSEVNVYVVRVSNEDEDEIVGNYTLNETNGYEAYTTSFPSQDISGDYITYRIDTDSSIPCNVIVTTLSNNYEKKIIELI